MGPKVVLDACVLFPPLVRGVVLGAAEASAFAPIWSDRILDEWRISAVRKQGVKVEDKVLGVQAHMATVFPDGKITPSPDMEAALSLPDPADTHVLATAIESKATKILTFNLRDFPRRPLAAYNIEATHPDGFLWLLFSEDPDRIIPAVQSTLRAHNILPDRHRAALKRARLPRFAKAWAAV